MSVIGFITFFLASLAFLAHAAGLHIHRSRKNGSVSVGHGLDTVGSTLRGAVVGGEANDADDDDDGDTSDDDDDESVAKPKAAAIRFSAEEAKKEAKKDTELKAALSQKGDAENELKELENEAAFKRKLAFAVANIENETQSTALASFLGSLKEDVRKFAAPAYSTHLKDEIREADDKIEKLKSSSPSNKSEPNKHKKVVASDAKEPNVVVPKEASDVENEVKDDTEKVKAGLEGAESIEDVKRHAAKTFALAFFVNVILLAGVFALASAANKLVSDYTWFITDQVVAIFLAVMHFQAFDSLLDFSKIGASNEIIGSVLHALAMFAMILALAWYFRKSSLTLAVLCGAGAHFVSFSAIHASALIQNKLFVGYSYTSEMCIIGLIVLAVGFAIVSYLAYTAKTKVKADQDGSYMDRTVDFENDVGATAFSVVFTMFVRFLLTGHHPVDDEAEFDHNASQRLCMFIYACVSLVASTFLSRIIARKASDAHTVREQRLYMFLNTVLALNVAWAFLYWGEWEFFEAWFPDSEVRGRLLFAIACSLVGGLCIVVLSRIVDDSRTARRSKKLALTSLGLLIAFSWEQCFDSSVEAMVEGKSHPVFWKVGCCLFMESVVIPVYALYMKPITMPAAEAIGA